MNLCPSYETPHMSKQEDVSRSDSPDKGTMFKTEEVHTEPAVMYMFQHSTTLCLCQSCGKFLSNGKHCKLLCALRRGKNLLLPNTVEGTPTKCIIYW